MADLNHELGVIRHIVDSPLSSKVAMFNKVANQHLNSQLMNPFSNVRGGSPGRPVFSKDEYGKPLAGSLTELRGQKANMQVCKEMLELCHIINSEGFPHPDNPELRVIYFGDLFNIYNLINDKCVGLLLRARKHKLVDFEGEMLFQRRDDEVPIFTVKPFEEIKKYLENKQEEFRRSASPAPRPTSMIIDSAKRCLSETPHTSPVTSKASTPRSLSPALEPKLPTLIINKPLKIKATLRQAHSTPDIKVLINDENLAKTTTKPIDQNKDESKSEKISEETIPNKVQSIIEESEDPKSGRNSPLIIIQPEEQNSVDSKSNQGIEQPKCDKESVCKPIITENSLKLSSANNIEPVLLSEQTSVTSVKLENNTEAAIEKSDESILKSEEPVLKSEMLNFKSDESILTSQESILKIEDPILKSEMPVMKSDESILTPEDPIAKSEEPILKSEEPIAKSEELILKSQSSNENLKQNQNQQPLNEIISNKEEQKQNGTNEINENENMELPIKISQVLIEIQEKQGLETSLEQKPLPNTGEVKIEIRPATPVNEEVEALDQ